MEDSLNDQGQDSHEGEGTSSVHSRNPWFWWDALPDIEEEEPVIALASAENQTLPPAGLDNTDGDQPSVGLSAPAPIGGN